MNEFQKRNTEQNKGSYRRFHLQKVQKQATLNFILFGDMCKCGITKKKGKDTTQN